MKVDCNLFIRINELKSCLLVVFTSMFLIHAALVTIDLNSVQLQNTFSFIKSNDKVTTYPHWHAYGQSEDDQSLTTSDIPVDGERSDSGTNDIKGSNLKTPQLPVSKYIQETKAGLNQFLIIYKNQQFADSSVLMQSIYSNAYQKIIVPLNSINPDISLALETEFDELIDNAEMQSPYDEIVNNVKDINDKLNEYGLITSANDIPLTPTIAFASSFSIIFREGLEASIILGAILSYLEVSRNVKFKKHVYFGIMVALVATMGIWFLFDYALNSSGLNKDLIKGITGIAAVVVLFWISFWALNRMESKRWVEFIKSRVGKAATTGSFMIFVFISFFTVFREGIETVIFYQSLLSFTSNIDNYIISGLIVGIIVVVTIAILIKKIMNKLPFRAIFGITMAIGAFMSVAFIGNAIRSLQEAGYISVTPRIDTFPILDPNVASMTGIHPTLETLSVQIILSLIYLIGLTYMIVFRPNEKKTSDSKLKR